MREGISIEVSAADRDRLERIVADRNSRQKHVWRARIILSTAEGCGTAEIMRPTPFAWTADPDRIIAKVNHGYQALASDPRKE